MLTRASEQGDIVRVPFRYTDRATRQHRPAPVASAGEIGADARLLWVVMTTSAENLRWPGDIDIGPDYRRSGLPAPSVIRPAKIATIESRDAGPPGCVSRQLMGRVLGAIPNNLALSPEGVRG